MTAVHRPLMRYFGGKWHLSPWIIAAMPDHRVYVEPYAGASSVLVRKPRSEVEVLGDIDPEVCRLLRQIRSPLHHHFLRAVARRIPYSTETVAALRSGIDEDRDFRTLRPVIRGAMLRCPAVEKSGSFGGFRGDGGKADRGSLPADEWRRWPDSLPAFHARLRGVQIECRPAVETLVEHDAVDAVHFVDPPYVPATRSAARKGYANEMSIGDHVELLDVLISLKGAVLLSGYDSTLYRDGLPGWTRIEKAATDAGGKRRVESLWLNPAAATRSPATAQSQLFGAAA